MSKFIEGITHVPCVADTIEVHSGDLVCKGINFGGKNVFFADDVFYFNYDPTVKYLRNGIVLNENCRNLMSCNYYLEDFSLNCRNVITANWMFYQCDNLQTLNFTDCSNIKYANQMFSRCHKLTSVSLNDMPNAESIAYIFYQCDGLKNVTLKNINASYCDGMLSRCNALESVTIGDFTNPNLTTNVGNNFTEYCRNLKYYKTGDIYSSGQTYLRSFIDGCTPDLVQFGNIYAYRVMNLPSVRAKKMIVGDMNNIESGTTLVSNAEEIHLGNLNTLSRVDGDYIIKSPFSKKLVIGDAPYYNFQSSGTSVASGAFEEIILGDFSSLSGKDGFQKEYRLICPQSQTLTSVTVGNLSSVTNATNMFYNCSNLKKVSISNFAPVTASFMFFNTSLSSIPDIDYTQLSYAPGMFSKTKIKDVNFTFHNVASTANSNSFIGFFEYNNLDNVVLNMPTAELFDSNIFHGSKVKNLTINAPSATTLQNIIYGGRVENLILNTPQFSGSFFGLTESTQRYAKFVKTISAKCDNMLSASIEHFYGLKDLDLEIPNATSLTVSYCYNLQTANITGSNLQSVYLKKCFSLETVNLDITNTTNFSLQNIFTSGSSMSIKNLNVKGLHSNSNISGFTSLNNLTYVAENALSTACTISATSQQLLDFASDFEIFRSKGWTVKEIQQQAIPDIECNIYTTKANSLMTVNGNDIYTDANCVLNIPNIESLESINIKTSTYSDAPKIVKIDISSTALTSLTLNNAVRFSEVHLNTPNLVVFSAESYGTVTKFDMTCQSLNADSVSYVVNLLKYSNLSTIDITLPDVQNINGAQLFYNKSGLTSVHIGGQVFSSTTYMFSNCYNLKSVQIDCSNVTNARSMFENCYTLTEVDYNNLDKVTSGAYMFTECYNYNNGVLELNLPSIKSLSGVGCSFDEISISASSVLSADGNLNIGQIGFSAYLPSLTSMTSGFLRSINTEVTRLNLPAFTNTDGYGIRQYLVTSSKDYALTAGTERMSSPMATTQKNETVSLTFPNLTYIQGNLFDSYFLSAITEYTFDAPLLQTASYICNLPKVEKFSLNLPSATSMLGLFMNAPIKTVNGLLDPEWINNITTADNAFNNSKLETFEMDMPSLRSAGAMFSYCKNLVKISGSFDSISISQYCANFLSNTTNLESADLSFNSLSALPYSFFSGSSLSHLTMSLNNLSTADYTFSGFSTLREVTLKMPSVTSMNRILYTHRLLTIADLGDLPALTSMTEAFNEGLETLIMNAPVLNNCRYLCNSDNLKYLDLKDTRLVNSQQAFTNCRYIQTLYFNVSGHNETSWYENFNITTLKTRLQELNLKNLNFNLNLSEFEMLLDFTYLAENALSVTDATLTINQTQANKNPQNIALMESKGWNIITVQSES